MGVPGGVAGVPGGGAGAPGGSAGVPGGGGGVPGGAAGAGEGFERAFVEEGNFEFVSQLHVVTLLPLGHTLRKCSLSTPSLPLPTPRTLSTNQPRTYDFFKPGQNLRVAPPLKCLRSIVTKTHKYIFYKL